MYTDSIALMVTSVNTRFPTDPLLATTLTQLNGLGTSIATGISTNVAATAQQMMQIGAAAGPMLAVDVACGGLQNLLDFVGAMLAGDVIAALLAQLPTMSGLSAIQAAIATALGAINTALAAAASMMAAFEAALAAYGIVMGILKNPCSVLGRINSLGSAVDASATQLAHARDAVNSLVTGTGGLPAMTPATLSAAALHISGSVGLGGSVTSFQTSVSAWL